MADTKPRREYKKKISELRLREAIKGSGGLISTVAKRLGVAYNTVRAALDRYPKCNELLEDENGAVADIAEANIIQKIKSANEMISLKASMWYLERRGGRGWVPNLEMKMTAELGSDAKEKLAKIYGEICEASVGIAPKNRQKKTECKASDAL